MGELVQGRSKYSDEDRRRAAVEYCVSGLMTKVSECTDIPETTLSLYPDRFCVRVHQSVTSAQHHIDIVADDNK